MSDQPGVKIDVSEIEAENVSSVQIMVNESVLEGAPSSPSALHSSLLRSSSSYSSSSSSSSSLSSSSSSSSSSHASPKDDQMREILLNDASVEAS